MSQHVEPGEHFKIASIAMGVCLLLLLLDTIAVVRSNSSTRIWEASKWIIIKDYS